MGGGGARKKQRTLNSIITFAAELLRISTFYDCTKKRDCVN